MLLTAIKRFTEMSLEFRERILEMVYKAGSGHLGGSLSLVEILIALYFYKLKYDTRNPKWEVRDRVIISKGHATPVVYLTLAKAGFFDESDLEGFRRLGSRLQGHVYREVPGIEFSTGSLGQGLSVGIGMALGARYKNLDYNVYVILGDGELQEGSVWEAAMFAGFHKVSNLCAIIDYNKVQENGFVEKILNIEPLREKWQAFGWNVLEMDGHDYSQIISTLDRFDELKISFRPTVIIAHTVKGKGITFMEYNHNFHGKAPNKEEFQKAIKELRDRSNINE